MGKMNAFREEKNRRLQQEQIRKQQEQIRRQQEQMMKQQRDIASIPTMVRDINELENNTQKLQLANRKVKKNRLILITVLFVMTTLACVSFKLVVSNTFDNKVAEYRLDTEEQINEYKQFIDSVKG